jgi:hypothetical protein
VFDFVEHFIREIQRLLPLVRWGHISIYGSADLAAKAGDAAGPMAQGLADKTEAAGGRLSTKGRELASDLRRETAVAKSGTGNPPLEPVEQTSAEEEAGLPPR